MSAISDAVRGIPRWHREFYRTDPEDIQYAGSITLWVRWFMLAFCVAEVRYRIKFGALSHILSTFYCLGMMAPNGYVHYLFRRRGTVCSLWMRCEPNDLRLRGSGLPQHESFPDLKARPSSQKTTK